MVKTQGNFFYIRTHKLVDGRLRKDMRGEKRAV